MEGEKEVDVRLPRMPKDVQYVQMEFQWISNPLPPEPGIDDGIEEPYEGSDEDANSGG